ncbi:insulin-like growth factor-binding protein 3 [Thalassophryne amazonica]|uniref:insulin-like growth factor-binding protein 3 n=1 Tax=Thalassophryne amazonica TaxID=390379 RepID=UPI0014716E5A|nr:insulin-like growth factor-binding protein 3 [Thalassophryne amazonica]
MDSCLRALCVSLVLASITRRSGALGPVIRCEPCDATARLLCKPLTKDCAEKVREPGCGCCLTCALTLGEPCGVYTARCGSELTCQHPPGDTKPLQALLEGRGICANATSRRTTLKPTPPPPRNELPEVQDEEQNSTSPGLQALDGTRRPVRLPPHPFIPLAKAEVLRREQQKRTQTFKMEKVSGALITEQQNFSLETKQEPDYGPCRREIESILSGLKITDTLIPRGFRIPNCDKKGFYKRKQCRPSKGRKRGFCWCVDKYGQPLPGFNGKEQGDTQYYNSESQ